MKQPEIAGVIDQIIGDPMDGIVVLAKFLGILNRLLSIMNLVADPEEAVLKSSPPNDKNKSP